MVKVYYKNSAGAVIDFAGKNYKMHKATDLLSYRWSWTNSEYVNRIEAFTMEYAEKSITVSIKGKNRDEYVKALDTISDVFEYDVKMLSPGKLYIGEYYLSCYIISAEQSKFDMHCLKTDKVYGILAESGQWMKETEYDLSVLTQIEDEADVVLKTAYIHDYPINLLQPPKFAEAAGVENATYIRNKFLPSAEGDIWVGTVDMEQGIDYQIVSSMEGVVFKVERLDGTIEEVANISYTAEETGIHKIIASVTELQEFYVVVNTGESYEGYPPNDYKIRALKEGEIVMEKIAAGPEMYMHGDFDAIESDYNVVYELTDYITASALDYPYDYTYDLVSARISKHVNNRNVVPADFILIIYGPCVNPAVYINGHLYQVNVTLYTGEYLEINSSTKRIHKVKVDGEKINCFYLRNRESYIFQKIGPGQQTVVKDGFGIKLIILEERSEARWWI